MGVLSWLKRRFRRKKGEDEIPPLPEGAEAPPEPLGELGAVTAENVKAKMDLMATRLDSLSTQYAALNERIKNIERLVTEIRSFCK